MLAHERWESLGWYWGKAPEWLGMGFPIHIIPTLVIPDFQAEDTPSHANINNLAGIPVIPVAITAVTSAASNANRNSEPSFLTLPNELLLMITTYLHIDSFYTLSICSKKLRVLLRQEVKIRFRRQFAPWANTPLIMVGENMDDNPPGITTHLPPGLNGPGEDDYEYR